jgi:SAM-dependent methyltransferase
VVLAASSSAAPALARRKSATSPVVFGRASAHELPLPDGCVDLVFMSQIYHHLPDPAAVARECRRVLRVGGYVCIRTATRENDVVVPNFFPAVRPMLDADLPSSDEISSNFAAAGFTPRHHEIVTEVLAPDWPSFVRKSALRADSSLARLSDTVFDQGMAALRAHCADLNPAEAVIEEIDWFVFKNPRSRDDQQSACSTLAANRLISTNERPLGVSKG